MNNLHIQHPDITFMERFGGKETEEITCPVCGHECDTFFKRDREIIGCDICVQECDAWEETNCY